MAHDIAARKNLVPISVESVNPDPEERGSTYLVERMHAILDSSYHRAAVGQELSPLMQKKDFLKGKQREQSCDFPQHYVLGAQGSEQRDTAGAMSSFGKLTEYFSLRKSRNEFRSDRRSGRRSGRDRLGVTAHTGPGDKNREAYGGLQPEEVEE
ncbi:hypothetical protein UY3_02046 [Chelonia mydas]|uniref:Uncharacterized protein n=1 Tax=Chelonia mydas TaxID=8469 RepID=M7BU27_CHEMY|nr:hypothetical protein UY3_02046 [Chelonia mydas]